MPRINICKYQLTKLSMSFNGVLALAKIFLGVYTLSLFPILSACYSLGIMIAKYFAITEHKRTTKDSISSEEIEKRHYRCYQLIGVVILVSSLLFIIYSLRLFIIQEPLVKYSTIGAITIAAVTFFEIGVAIRGVFLARKKEDRLMESIRLTNLATALISLVLTQTAIMSFAHGGDYTIYIGCSGVLFGGIAAIIGGYMIVKGRVRMNSEKPVYKRLPSN